MTEKKPRFFIHKDIVSDTEMKIPITLWQDKEQQKKFCDELNKLNDENEHLKKSIKRQQSSNDECAKLIEEQQKENEQLKKLIHIADGLIGWNTIPQVRREWEKQKKEIWND